MRLLLSLFTFAAIAAPQSSPPLRLRKTIPLPDVQGRIDHMSLDASNGRLFVAALGNNTVEVIDIEKGERIHTIPNLREPQGVLYLPDNNRLYVANGEDGTLRLFDGLSYKPLKTVKLGNDADNLRFDVKGKHVYVGYGAGALAVMSEDGTTLAEIPLDGHPESFQLENNGKRIFVNVPRTRKVAVTDRTTSSVVSTWSTDGALSNYPMALDEADHRLFIVCRLPARLVVLDTITGKPVGNFPVVGDSDDIFYDQARKRVYAIGGEGAVSVFQQDDPDHYREIAKITTEKGARTGFFSAERGELFVAVRSTDPRPAEIRVYAVD